jgi:hypothetical protein
MENTYWLDWSEKTWLEIINIGLNVNKIDNIFNRLWHLMNNDLYSNMWKEKNLTINWTSTVWIHFIKNHQNLGRIKLSNHYNIDIFIKNWTDEVWNAAFIFIKNDDFWLKIFSQYKYRNWNKNIWKYYFSELKKVINNNSNDNVNKYLRIDVYENNFWQYVFKNNIYLDFEKNKETFINEFKLENVNINNINKYRNKYRNKYIKYKNKYINLLNKKL